MRLAKIYHPKLAPSIYGLALAVSLVPAAWAESVQVEAIFFKHLDQKKSALRYQVTPSHTLTESRFFSPEEQDRDAFGLGYIKVQALEHVLLHPHFESLFQSKKYQVLFYQAWHQPLINPNHALLIPLSNSKTPDIQGTLQISSTKGIEAEWTVTLQNPENMEQSVTFTEKRLIRLNDLQYFDHPVVGLLLKVRSIPKEVNETPTSVPTIPIAPPLTPTDSSPTLLNSSKEQPIEPLLEEIPVEPDSEAHD